MIWKSPLLGRINKFVCMQMMIMIKMISINISIIIIHLGVSWYKWKTLVYFLPAYLCQCFVLLEIKTTCTAIQIGGSYSPCLTIKDCAKNSSSRGCKLSNWTCPATIIIDFTHELYQVEQDTEKVLFSTCFYWILFNS